MMQQNPFINQLNIIQQQIELLKNQINESPWQVQTIQDYSTQNLQQLSKEELINLLQQKNQQENQLNQSLKQELSLYLKNLQNLNQTLNNKDQREVYKICFTGGPCAGKTTALSIVSEWLRETEFAVFCVPEAASLLFSSGCNLDLSKYTTEQQILFQYYLLMLQISLEDTFKGISFTQQQKQKIVLLCDRGTMDGQAYITQDIWQRILQDNDLDESKLRDQRYDQVIHLSTTADGAEKYYSLNNNQARSEDIQLAVQLDLKLQQAWMAHPHFVQINNEFETFQKKMEVMTDVVFGFLGLPQATTYCKKLIIRNPQRELVSLIQKEIQSSVQESLIEDILIVHNENHVESFWQRISNGSKTFSKCVKKIVQNEFEEKRRQITMKEFQMVQGLQLQNQFQYTKTRNSFMYQKSFFILDTMRIDGLSFSICTIQRHKDRETVYIPTIIQKNIIKEVEANEVNLLNEFLISNKEKSKVILNQEIKEKLKGFEYV